MKQVLHMKTNRVNQYGTVGLSDTEPPAKENTEDRPRPHYTFVAVMEFGSHVGPKQPGWVLSQNLLTVCQICSSSWDPLSVFSRKGSTYP